MKTKTILAVRITDFTKTKHGQQLVNELLKSNSAVPLNTIIEHLKISRRSVFYTITKVNEELSACRLDEIENLRGVGYRLPSATKQALIDEQSNKRLATTYAELFSGNYIFRSLDPNDRLSLTLFCLISRSATSLTELMHFFQISKNTVIKDLAKIDEHLLPDGLLVKNSTKGKYVAGAENIKRRWVFENFHQLSALTAAQTALPPSPHFRDQLKLLERITGNSFTDDSMTLLVTFTRWLNERVVNHPLPPRPLSASDHSLTFTWAESFLNDLHINSSAEALFLAEIVNTQAFQHISQDNPMIPVLRPIATQMIQRFNEIAGVALPTSDQNLNKKLTVHLVSTYYRVKYHISYQNPLVNQIKSSYHETFVLVKQAVQPFNDFTNDTLSDDEIALITVYFSGALRSIDLPIREKQSVMVICSSGIGTSELLISQLRSRYPDVSFIGPYNTFQYENIRYQTVPLVISTIELPKMPEQVPVLTVPVIPTAADWQEIGTHLQSAGLVETPQQPIQVQSLMDIIATHTRIVDPQGLENDLKNYLNTRTQQPRLQMTTGAAASVELIDKTADWRSAIQLSMRKLVNEHVISQRYVNKIIQLTEKHGAYMAIGKGVFLAHATPEAGVNELGFSYTYFKHPFQITGSDKKINFVVGLAPVDQRKHLTVLTHLLQCVQNDDWMASLKKVTKKSELNQVLREGKLLS